MPIPGSVRSGKTKSALVQSSPRDLQLVIRTWRTSMTKMKDSTAVLMSSRRLLQEYSSQRVRSSGGIVRELYFRTSMLLLQVYVKPVMQYVIPPNEMPEALVLVFLLLLCSSRLTKLFPIFLPTIWFINTHHLQILFC